jgi:Fe-Mn family superoxide dismutase
MNRRHFLRNSSLASATVLPSVGGLMMMAGGCRSSRGSKPGNVMDGAPGFEQRPLGYSYQSLEPYIDAATMEIHYTKHAAAYTKNMGDAMRDENISNQAGLQLILENISKYSTKMRNNAGGHYNHESFWRMMTPGGKAISNNMNAAIEKAFGSFNDFKNQFTNSASQRFGSGWAWLYLDKQKNLKIGSTPNQDNPLMDVSDIKGFPLLGLDVWEHAYYLKYQNKRADYIASWWNIVNWEEVEKRFNWAMKIN